MELDETVWHHPKHPEIYFILLLNVDIYFCAVIVPDFFNTTEAPTTKSPAAACSSNISRSLTGNNTEASVEWILHVGDTDLDVNVTLPAGESTFKLMWDNGTVCDISVSIFHGN